MKGTWIKYDNHIAIQVSNEILHPSAMEVYAVIGGEENSFVEDIECVSINAAFPNIRFSKIGTDIKCTLYNNEQNEICIKVFCERRGAIVDIDIIEGQIVDQCITCDEWFYVTGNINELNEIFTKVGIKKVGAVSVSQYVEFVRSAHIFGMGTFENRVKTDLLDKPIDMNAELPYGLQAKLYNYQKVGYLWMRYMLSENTGCILGDEMGLSTIVEDSGDSVSELITEWGSLSVGMMLSLLNVEKEEERYAEGGAKQVLVNRYERNPVNRELCLAANGYACKICGMDFGDVYGELGRRFIHVHHIEMVSLHEEEYYLNPEVDLIPVCPNCHAMLHRVNPPLQPEALRQVMKERKEVK